MMARTVHLWCVRISPSSQSYADTLWAQNQKLRLLRSQARPAVRESMAADERMVVEGSRTQGVAGSIGKAPEGPKLTDMYRRRTLGAAPKHQTPVALPPAKTELGKLIDIFG